MLAMVEMVDKHKITVVENVKSHMKKYTKIFEFDLQIYSSGVSRSNP